ncbi:unnamed protein product [Rhizopus stolonifer]
MKSIIHTINLTDSWILNNVDIIIRFKISKSRSTDISYIQKLLSLNNVLLIRPLQYDLLICSIFTDPVLNMIFKEHSTKIGCPGPNFIMEEYGKTMKEILKVDCKEFDTLMETANLLKMAAELNYKSKGLYLDLQ